MDIVAIIAIVLAYTIKGICGFANTIIFGTIMSYSIDNINITPIDLLVGCPSNIIISWRERKSISAKVWIPLSVLVIIGSIPGALFLKIGNAQLIKILFGIIVILIGFESILKERKTEKRESSKGLLLIIGIISGVLTGLFGIGALLIVYINRTTSNQNEFRGNICIVFLVENIFRIILYTITGIFNLEVIKSAIMLMPFMIIGLVTGIFLSHKISEAVVKKTVIILLIISGGMLIINNISCLFLFFHFIHSSISL